MKFFGAIASRGEQQLRRLRAKGTVQVELLKCLKSGVALPALLDGLRSGEKALSLLRKQDPHLLRELFPQIEESIREADEVCAHNFDLLGSGMKNIDRQPGKIDWHRDFKSGKSWEPGIFYTDIVRDRDDDSDIKVLWELSRFQHLPTLGKAYWLTGDEKYAGEFVSQINDWMDSNPPQRGANWACSMEVAIRAVNWLWGLYFFAGSPQVSDDFLVKFLESLIVHGRHIRGNLERSWGGANGNHYLSDIVGLVYLGVLSPEFKEAKKWRDFGVRELVKEMRKQVYGDGVDFEGSISYHRLVIELFLCATMLCLRNGITFPDWYLRRLEMMLEFIVCYTKPDGTAPQIGDNDDGRLQIMSQYGGWSRLDHRYLLAIGAALFSRPDFKQAAGEFPEEAFWLLGEGGLRKFEALPEQKNTFSSKGFPEGGFYIMRRDGLCLIMDCVPAASDKPSGHKHNSRLSFELFAYDKSFIVDPGAYIYTADREMRNLFRSTSYHNTVVVDGEEQDRFDARRLFWVESDAIVKVNKWETTGEYDYIDAEHSGYSRLASPVIHRRQINFDKTGGCWTIKDILEGSGEHRFDLYFHLAPMDLTTEGLEVRTKTNGANIAIIPVNKDGLSLEIQEGWVSPGYGRKVAAPIVRYSMVARAPLEFVTTIKPIRGIS